MTNHDDLQLSRMLAADPDTGGNSVAGRVVRRLPPRRHVAATLASLVAAGISGWTAASLAPDMVNAVGDIITGDAAARIDGVVLVAVPVVVLATLARRSA